MPELLPKDWAEALQPVLQPNYIGRVQEFLDTVYLIDTVYPERQNVFAALKETPLDKVKVVILGQIGRAHV